MKRALIPAVLICTALFACTVEEEPTSSGAGAGPETDSANTEHPPPEDLNDDMSCSSVQFVGPKATGTLTNHSSGLSGYMISVGFIDDAGTRVAEGTAFVNGVQPNQTATWEAPAFSDVPFARCEIISVERMAQ
jgi:hypothetical protein